GGAADEVAGEPGGAEGEGAAGREDDQVAAGFEDAGHVVQGGPGVVEEVEGAEAADGVEGLVAEGEVGGVGADVLDVGFAGAGRRGVADGAGEHGLGGVEADDEAVLADALGERPGDVAGAAGDVQDGGGRPGGASGSGQAEPAAGHGVFGGGGGADRPAFGDVAADGPPDPFVDLRQERQIGRA